MGLDATDLGWIAGFLDGEGYFSIYSRGSAGVGQPRGLMPRALVRVNQAGTREPLDKLQRLLGGSIHEASRRTNKDKRVWGWQWQSASSLRQYLPLLIPHLTTKKHEAELILRFVSLIKTRSTAKRLTQDEIDERFAIADEIRTHRGGQ